MVHDVFWTGRLLAPVDIFVVHDGLLISSMAATTYVMNKGYGVIRGSVMARQYDRQSRRRGDDRSCLRLARSCRRALARSAVGARTAIFNIHRTLIATIFSAVLGP